MVAFSIDNYKFSYGSASQNEGAKVSITTKEAGKEYSLFIKGKDDRGDTYGVYPPINSSGNWVIRLGKTDKSISDPNALWGTAALEKKGNNIIWLARGARLTSLASAALLGCKLFGSVAKGHWALYLTITTVSVVAYKYLSNNYYDNKLKIANRIYSAFGHSVKGGQEINDKSKLLLPCG